MQDSTCDRIGSGVDEEWRSRNRNIDAIKKQLLQDKEFLLEIEKSMGGTSCREVEETEPEDSDNLDMDEDMMLAGMSIFENEI